MTTALTGVTGEHFQSCIDMLCGLSAVQTWMNVDNATEARERIYLSRINPETNSFDDVALGTVRPYILMSGEPFDMEATSIGPTWKFNGSIALCLVSDVPSALKDSEQEALIAFWNATDAIIEGIADVGENSGEFVARSGKPYMPERSPKALRPTQGDYHSRVIVLGSGI